MLGFQAMFLCDECGCGAATIIFEDALTGLCLAEWELWDKEADSSPHKVLRDALHAGMDGTSPADPPVGAGVGNGQTTAPIAQPADPDSVLHARRLTDGSGFPMTSHARQFASATQPLTALHNAPMVQAQAREHARLLGALPYITW